MARTTLLTTKVVDSIELLLKDYTPTDYVGTDKEAGIMYLTLLVQSHRDPVSVQRRQKNAAAAKQSRK